MYEHLVVPLDLTDDSDRALGPAAAIAGHLGADLDVVVVGSEGLDPDVDIADATAHAEAAGCRPDRYLRLTGEPVDALVGLQDGHTLLCLATHARRPFGELLLGSVSEEILRKSRCPLVLVGPEVPNPIAPYATLLACFDGTHRWQPLIDELPTWIIPGGLEARFLQVLPSRPPNEAASSPSHSMLPELDDRLEMDGLHVERDVTYDDDPVEAIGRYADKLTNVLIAVASHRSSRRGRLTHPSVTLTLARRSPHPVLAVPSDSE